MVNINPTSNSVGSMLISEHRYYLSINCVHVLNHILNIFPHIVLKCSRSFFSICSNCEPFHVDNNLIYLNTKQILIEDPWKKRALVLIWSNILRNHISGSVTFHRVETQRVAWRYYKSNSSQSNISYVFNQLYRLIWRKRKINSNLMMTNQKAEWSKVQNHFLNFSLRWIAAAAAGDLVLNDGVINTIFVI